MKEADPPQIPNEVPEVMIDPTGYETPSSPRNRLTSVLQTACWFGSFFRDHNADSLTRVLP